MKMVIVETTNSATCPASFNWATMDDDQQALSSNPAPIESTANEITDTNCVKDMILR